MKYLVLKRTDEPGMLKVVWEFDDLQKAISYLLVHNIVADGMVVKVIDNWEIKEKII
jgi:hypothetical protein